MVTENKKQNTAQNTALVLQNEPFSVEKLMYFTLVFYYLDASTCLVDILYIFNLHLFKTFICGIGAECVHNLGFSCQLGDFLRNFMSAKGSLYFLKFKYQGS